METTKRISKHELIQKFHPVTRPTFLKWIKELTQDKECPFTYDQFKRGHYVNSKHALFILNNL